MATSLQEQCYKSIFEALRKAPPGIQELVANDTKARMIHDVRQEMYPAILHDVKLQLVHLLPGLVSEIATDIVTSMTEHGRFRRDFRAENTHLCPVLVECGIQTAEEVVRNLEERYVHAAFPLEPDESFSDDYPDSDGALSS